MLQRLRNRAQGQEGFTLIELLVVILIIGILAAVAIPTFLSQVNKGKDSNIQSNLNTVQTAEATYNTSNSAYTTSIKSLEAVEQTITGFASNVTLSATAQNGATDPTPNGTGTVNFSAADYSGATVNGGRSTTSVTYYLTSYSDGGIADTCYVPANVNPSDCALANGATSGAGTWGNGDK